MNTKTLAKSDFKEFSFVQKSNLKIIWGKISLTAKKYLVFFLLICVVGFQKNSFQKVFNGKNFEGWEGDVNSVWNIQDGALVGGNLTETVPHNYFLCMTKSYTDFHLKLKFKLENANGFANAGVQFRSQRLNNPAYEMTGYQADIGDGYWGSLYDESRRDKVMAKADSSIIKKYVKPNDWNEYEIIAQKNHIIIKMNGYTTVDYLEKDLEIPQKGLIGLQIHGGGKTKIWYKDILIKRL